MTTTRLLIEAEGHALLEIGHGNHALLPMEEGERATAFKALCDALALLAGLKPPSSPDASVAGSGERAGGSARCQVGRRSGVVVHLAIRQGNPA